MTPPVIALVGPTAAGKSRIALRLAPLYRGEIVSVDSMQVYEGMDIGTAKPSPAERALVPHHLIDVVPADRTFSVAEYQRLARAAVEDIRSRGGTPFLVGGSGLYLRAVLDDLDFAGQGSCEGVRRSCDALPRDEARRLLFSRLEEVDPISAERIGPHNLRRIVRALEVYEQTGRPFSEGRRDFQEVPQSLEALVIGVDAGRETLRRLIDERVEGMFRAGLVEEVRRLVEAGGLSPTASQALGYRQVLYHLDNKATLEETMEKVKSETRRYAKRQMTWFRRDARICWVSRVPGDSEGLEATARAVAQRIEANTRGKEP